MANPHMNEPTTKAADATRDATNEATRTARAVTDQAAKAGEQALRAGSDVARRGAETTQEVFKAGVDTATESFQRLTDQFTRTLGFAEPQSEELARKSLQNLEAVAQVSKVLTRGVQEVSREWFGSAQDRFTKNLEGLNTLARCRSVQHFVAVQSDLVRDNLQQAIDDGRRIAEISVRVADEAAKTIQGQLNANVEYGRRAA